MKSIRIFSVFYFLAIILIIFAADFDLLPESVITTFGLPYGDKIAHFILMGIFCLLANYSLNNRTILILSKNILLGSLIVIVLVTLEEISQSFFPSRTASVFDLASSYLGIFIIGNIPQWKQKFNSK